MPPYIGQIMLLILIAAVGIWLYRKKRSAGMFKEAQDLSFLLNDVAGNTEAKAMLHDMISFIKNPGKYADAGARMPRGILFYGPPGTGKTLMAKAIAGEAGVPFYACSGSDFMQTYVGVGASRIRELFKTAKKAEKAVIFIDEIDAIGKKRGRTPGASHDERDQTLNALLAEMSGFHERDGVVVIAATNRLDTLDDALTRPGRFDRLIEISLPDVNARERILALHSADKPLDESVDLKALAKSTVSFSGAMLENLLNEAAIFAANENDGTKILISQTHIDKAFFTVIAGAEKTDTSFITAEDRKITAFHEAAHALVTRLLLPDSYISKVTIIPSTRGAGGFSLSIPKDTLYMTKEKLLANMKVLLAGRIGEELIFGDKKITTGASNDIEKVSTQMVNFITSYGMDEDFGIFNMNVLANSGLGTGDSEAKLVSLCQDRLKQLYCETKDLLAENLVSLRKIADELLNRESLNQDDIEGILG
ncbi:MAG: AAA family ATPase [Lachnospiraceae bacterium]|nr:AAA family ATPase [Lachnospiraceae bacterium]